MLTYMADIGLSRMTHWSTHDASVEGSLNKSGFDRTGEIAWLSTVREKIDLGLLPVLRLRLIKRSAASEQSFQGMEQKEETNNLAQHSY
jgi:hypothetical protein